MENLFMFLATSLILRISAPRFKRYLIGQSGGTSLLVSGSDQLHIKYTKEGDVIYFSDSAIGNVAYGLICIQMKQLYTLWKAETILVQYINRVRKPLGIAYNISMEIKKTAGQITITDYWQDNNGTDWKIKGYTNGKTVAVLYVKNITEAAVKEHDAFLNGFKFSQA
ncbi:MAG: hypothetical protein JWR72_260 [Flavisolibacter sp.]|jgi:hypothetical protein|nr:hypothetical protein [Flavisolibacter sp.]